MCAQLSILLAYARIDAAALRLQLRDRRRSFAAPVRKNNRRVALLIAINVVALALSVREIETVHLRVVSLDQLQLGGVSQGHVWFLGHHCGCAS